MSKRFGGIKGCKYKTSSWHSNGFPDGNNIGSTVYCRGEAHRYTVHLHRYYDKIYLQLIDVGGLRLQRVIETDVVVVKNLNAPRPSEHCLKKNLIVVVVVVVSHIQRIGCQPEKTTLHGGQSRSWSAEQGKENKIKSLAAYPPPPPTPHTARSEKINKITRRIYRRYAGGRSRVRTRIPSARRLGLWVWLRKILHSRLR